MQLSTRTAALGHGARLSSAGSSSPGSGGESLDRLQTLHPGTAPYQSPGAWVSLHSHPPTSHRTTMVLRCPTSALGAADSDGSNLYSFNVPKDSLALLYYKSLNGFNFLIINININIYI